MKRSHSDNDPTAVLHKAEETKRLVSERSQVAQIMHKACGDEYVVGEGLKDL